MLARFLALNRRCSDFISRRFPSFFGSRSYVDDLKGRINKTIHDLRPGQIIEAGGIDRPLLCKSDQYVYVGIDIAVCDGCYEIYDQFLVQSIESPLDIQGGLIISTTLLEHVPDNDAAVRSIARALEPGGVTHHYVPSKWHPYSIALRIVGPAMQKKLIPLLRPGAEVVTGYPAYFDHCSAPAMRKLFAKNGLINVEATAYYRANDYFAAFVPAYLIVTCFENLCRILGIELCASGFVVSGMKPAAALGTLAQGTLSVELAAQEIQQ